MFFLKHLIFLVFRECPLDDAAFRATSFHTLVSDALVGNGLRGEVNVCACSHQGLRETGWCITRLLGSVAHDPCFTCSSSPDLRFSMALCDEEKAFRQQRKENIKENMKKLLGPENSEGLCSTRDVSWKFFKLYCNLRIRLFVLSPQLHPNLRY